MQRILTLSFIVAVVLCSLGAWGQPTSSRPIILLIHGRDQGASPRDSTRAADTWINSLKLTTKNIQKPVADSDVIFAWYGDLLGNRNTHICTHHEWSPQELRDSLNYIKQKGIQAFMNAAASLPGNQLLLRQMMPDVELYLSDQRNQCAINDRVEKYLAMALRTKRPVIVIAHSLGSLIAYNLLNRHPQIPPKVENVRLLTIGSMLGLNGVRDALLGKYITNLVVPSGVIYWNNIINTGDNLAFPLTNIWNGQQASQLATDTRIFKNFGHDAAGYIQSDAVESSLKVLLP